MVTPSRNFRRMLAVGVAAVISAALVATPAAAHTELRGSDPEEGATVETLEQVRLEFSSALLDIGTELALIDSAGTAHELAPEFPAGENAVVAPVDADAVAAGETVLDWRIVAEDGHPIEGEIAFTYAPVVPDEPVEQPAPEPTDAPATTEEPAAEEPADAVEPTASTTPVTTDTINAGPGGPSVWVWVLIGLAVAGLAATAVGLARKRDNP